MLRVHHGDIHVQPLDRSKPFEIARKPANVVGAVLQPRPRFETPSQISSEGWPTELLPAVPNRADGSPWKVDQTENAWKAQCSGGDGKRSLGYGIFIAWSIQEYGIKWMETGSFPVSHRTRMPCGSSPISRITTLLEWSQHTSVYSHEETTSRLPSGATVKRWVRVNKFAPTYRSGKEMPEATLRGYNNIYENDGLHWVGDLACEFELDIESKSGSVLVDLVEFVFIINARSILQPEKLPYVFSRMAKRWKRSRMAKVDLLER